MSEARWAAKGLDEEDNIEEAIAIIQQAIDVFKYNLKLDVQGEMRTTHNKVWTEIDVFHDAIVALRAQNEEEAPDFNIAKLWQEYIMYVLTLPMTFFQHDQSFRKWFGFD